jgi:tetratricopeptide (TPR) repeat protein
MRGTKERSLEASVKRVVLLLAFALLLAGAHLKLTVLRDSRPPEARLGFFPPAPVIRALSADQYQFISHVISLQCLFYFGSLVERPSQQPEFYRIYRALFTSTRLDPYNMDAYYFAQAVLTWESGNIQRVNELLEYGFEHRTWDWYLPFFISFNYAYFVKDYEKAAVYLRKAAELNPKVNWFASLAARYYYEGGSTTLALAYLKEMIATTRNEAIKKRLLIRAEAFEKILQIEQAVGAYKKHLRQDPKDLSDLVKAGVLAGIPVDPYGGSFYLDDQGRVRTTSKLAPIERKNGTHKN